MKEKIFRGSNHTKFGRFLAENRKFLEADFGHKNARELPKMPQKRLRRPLFGFFGRKSPRNPTSQKSNFRPQNPPKPAPSPKSLTISSKSALEIYLKSWRKKFFVGQSTRILADFGPKIENFWREGLGTKTVEKLSLIHIWRCRRLLTCRSRWSPYH